MSELLGFVGRLLRTVLYRCPGLASAWVELDAWTVPNPAGAPQVEWRLGVVCPDEETFRKAVAWRAGHA